MSVITPSPAFRTKPLGQPIVEIPFASPHLLRALALTGAAPAIAGAIAYNGGPLIEKVRLYAIFWGSVWTGANAGSVNDLTSFFDKFVSSSFLDNLGAEYSAGAYHIGHGSFISPGIVIPTDPPATLTDSQIQDQLNKCISEHALTVDGNSLFAFMFGPNVNVVDPFSGGGSCSGWTGYHWSTSEQKYYAVVTQCRDIKKPHG